MKTILQGVALRLALCAAAIYPLWRVFGAFGLLFGAPLLGVALARPLYELTAEFVRLTRWVALRDVQGRYFAFKGQRVRVIEDAAHCRWLKLADVHTIVGRNTSERALQLALPTAVRRIGIPPATYLQCEALPAYLGRATSLRTLHFLHWAEREIAHPARTLRARQADARRAQETHSGEDRE
jgi:hypothetical protein